MRHLQLGVSRFAHSARAPAQPLNLPPANRPPPQKIIQLHPTALAELMSSAASNGALALVLKQGTSGKDVYGDLKDGNDAISEVELICNWLMDPIACPTTWPVLLVIRQENPHYGTMGWRRRPLREHGQGEARRVVRARFGGAARKGGTTEQGRSAP